MPQDPNERDVATLEELTISTMYKQPTSTFFINDGTPKYYYNRTYPIDIQCVSQGIDTLGYFSEIDESSLDLGLRVAQWTIENMQDQKGQDPTRDDCKNTHATLGASYNVQRTSGTLKQTPHILISQVENNDTSLERGTHLAIRKGSLGKQYEALEKWVEYESNDYSHEL